MAKLLKRPLAETDLEEIWWYIAQDSPNNADKFLDTILEKCERIAEFPHIGESRNELIKNLRCFPVGSYLIFYFPIEDGVDIVRVIHGSRDFKTLFFEA